MNVQNFVILITVCTCMSTIFLGIMIIALYTVKCEVERICNYLIDIFSMTRDIKYRCADFKDDNSSNLYQLHSIEKQLDSELNMFKRLSGDISVIKKHTEKIEKNSAIK